MAEPKWLHNKKEYWQKYRLTPEVRAREVARGYKRNYGITVAEYDFLLEAQGGVCAICEQPPNGTGRNQSKLHIDHNHQTKTVRALLCSNCNIGIGKLGESPERLLRAAQYVDNHRE